jgi:hypothetical protein
MKKNMKSIFKRRLIHLQMIKIIFAAIISMLILSGCSGNKNAVKDFEDSLRNIEVTVMGQTVDWDTANKEVDQLFQLFNKNLWRMQLLGDEDEFESLKSDIHQLQAAVKYKDIKEAGSNIASIKSNLYSIFKGNKIIGEDKPKSSKNKTPEE